MCCYFALIGSVTYALHVQLNVGSIQRFCMQHLQLIMSQSNFLPHSFIYFNKWANYMWPNVPNLYINFVNGIKNRIIIVIISKHRYYYCYYMLIATIRKFIAEYCKMATYHPSNNMLISHQNSNLSRSPPQIFTFPNSLAKCHPYDHYAV